jgi:hypothetical protein
VERVWKDKYQEDITVARAEAEKLRHEVEASKQTLALSNTSEISRVKDEFTER